jgi:hypothetical protein
MRISYPIFKPSIQKTRKPLFHIAELIYHTVLPCAITYIAVKNNQPILLVFLLLPLFVRFRPDEAE